MAKEFPTYTTEKNLVESGYKYVVGVDEVARGCLFGSVVASAVYIPPESVEKLYGKVHDSKQLSEKKRDGMYDLIIENCKYGIGEASNEEIDEINILQATKLAMRRALNNLPIYKDYIIIDGNFILDGIPLPQASIVKGDSVSLSIAAASVIAKVTRDRQVKELDPLYDLYDIKNNKGYGTAKHRKAISEYGPTPLHRRSFRGVKEYL